MNNSIANLVQQSAEITMTLKEITDILEVRHNDAMQTVRLMMRDPAFSCATEISYHMPAAPGVRAQTITTFALNKRQSIAVAARLNTSLLMSIIDRWQELEAAQRAPEKPAYNLLTATVSERLINEISVAFEAMELYKQVEERLAIGDFCTWISFCAANDHIVFLRKGYRMSHKLSLTVAKLYRRDFGGKTKKVGIEGTDTVPQVVYPTDWLMKAAVEAAAEYGRKITDLRRPEVAKIHAPLATATVDAFHELQQLTYTQH